MKPYLLNVVTPDPGVVSDVQIFGRVQDEKGELFKQKDAAASTGMKKSSYTVSWGP